MPQAVSWLVFALKLILPFLSGGYLLRRMLAHSVCLAAQRTSDDSDENATYRFALQNNEDVPLSDHQKLVIRILDEGGQFDIDPAVTVYAGCNKIRTSFDARRQIWTMLFIELPAYDTWTIECKMNREARNIEMNPGRLVGGRRDTGRTPNICCSSPPVQYGFQQIDNCRRPERRAQYCLRHWIVFRDSQTHIADNPGYWQPTRSHAISADPADDTAEPRATGTPAQSANYAAAKG